MSDASQVTDHEFVPRHEDEPWGVCRGCGLAEAAHRRAYEPLFERPDGVTVTGYAATLERGAA